MPKPRMGLEMLLRAYRKVGDFAAGLQGETEVGDFSGESIPDWTNYVVEFGELLMLGFWDIQLQ